MKLLVHALNGWLNGLHNRTAFFAMDQISSNRSWLWTVLSGTAGERSIVNRTKSHLLFNRPIFWLLDGQNRTRLRWASWYLPLSTPPECPTPFTRAITRTAINPLYFSCTLSDYLSHDLALVQRHNSDLGFVRGHCWSVGYLGCWAQLWLEVSWLPTSC